MGLVGHIRVPNRANTDPMASKAHVRDKMLQGRTGENLTGGSRTYGQGCNSGDNTVQKLSNFHFAEMKLCFRISKNCMLSIDN